MRDRREPKRNRWRGGIVPPGGESGTVRRTVRRRQRRDYLFWSGAVRPLGRNGARRTEDSRPEGYRGAMRVIRSTSLVSERVVHHLAVSALIRKQITQIRINSRALQRADM